eukprot:evm.model.NODE_1070_length_11091_cov_46.747272.3
MCTAGVWKKKDEEGEKGLRDRLGCIGVGSSDTDDDVWDHGLGPVAGPESVVQ